MSFYDIIKNAEPVNYNYDAIIGKRRIVLCGAGATGYRYATQLLEQGYKIACFCDSEKRGLFKNTNIEIFDYESGTKKNSDAVYIITTSPAVENEIRQRLFLNGIHEKQIIPLYKIERKFFISAKDSKKNIMQHIDDFSFIYDKLSDEKSKNVYQKRIEYEFKCIAMPCDDIEEQYFDNLVLEDKRSEEVFYDCGACRGETSIAFINKKRHKYKKIYCFEPDQKNFLLCKKNLSEYGDIECFQFGVWNHEREINFINGLGGSSQIAINGDSTIKTISLDAFIKRSNLTPPTYIKMDIEGAELNALIGAASTIEKYHPILGISIYHKFEDLYAIPLYIIKNFSEYKLYIRQYTNTSLETVIYAI